MVQSVNTLLVAAAAFGALSAFGVAVPVKNGTPVAVSASVAPTSSALGLTLSNKQQQTVSASRFASAKPTSSKSFASARPTSSAKSSIASAKPLASKTVSGHVSARPTQSKPVSGRASATPSAHHQHHKHHHHHHHASGSAAASSKATASSLRVSPSAVSAVRPLTSKSAAVASNLPRTSSLVPRPSSTPSPLVSQLKAKPTNGVAPANKAPSYKAPQQKQPQFKNFEDLINNAPDGANFNLPNFKFPTRREFEDALEERDFDDSSALEARDFADDLEERDYFLDVEELD